MQQLTVSQVCLSFLVVIRALECGNITDVIMLQINNLLLIWKDRVSLKGSLLAKWMTLLEWPSVADKWFLLSNQSLRIPECSNSCMYVHGVWICFLFFKWWRFYCSQPTISNFLSSVTPHHAAVQQSWCLCSSSTPCAIKQMTLATSVTTALCSQRLAFRCLRERYSLVGQITYDLVTVFHLPVSRVMLHLSCMLPGQRQVMWRSLICSTCARLTVTWRATPHQ